MIKLLQILKEEIELVPRRSPEDRMAINTRILNKKIDSYIKNGSKGDLDLTGYKSSELPDGLKTVGGWFDLDDSGIKELPNGLKVKRSLSLSNSEIEQIPNDIQIGEDLYLFRSKIKSLPDNLKIKGNLDVSNTEIEFLPKGLEVGRVLDIMNTKIKITSLPKDIKVKGGFSFRTNQLGDLKKEYNKNPRAVENKIRKMYPGLKGNLYIY